MYFCHKNLQMKFSVITINYNNIEGLRHTVESVVGQTYDDYEYIIIDGGSTDGSVDVIKEYYSKIDYWVSEKDRGIYHAMNKGVVHAHGNYCLFLNSGDEFCNSMVLEKVSTLINGEDIIIGNVVSKHGNQHLFAPPSREISLYYLYSGTVPHQSTFIKVELQKNYPYDENLKIVSDWKFFLQSIIFDNCSVKYIDENISFFDQDGISTSNPETTWNEKVSVLKEMLPVRVIADYKLMKSSECLTQSITPQLRYHYLLDRVIYKLCSFVLKFFG